MERCSLLWKHLPLATELRGRAEATPVLPVDPWPPEPAPEKRRSRSKPKSTLDWEGEWYQDEAKKRTHRELVWAGMERARLQGKHIGRPKVTEREGFPKQFKRMVERIRSGDISRRRAARELDIGYATLKRLLDALPQPSDDNGSGTLPHNDKEVLYYAYASSLTESLNT